MMTTRILALAAIALLTALACDSATAPKDTGVPTGRALKMALAHDSLFFGKAVTFAVSDSADTLDTPIEHEWSSSDTSVAIVDDNGTVLAVGIGSARITVQRAGARDTFRLRAVAMRADNGVNLVQGAEGGGGAVPLHCAIGADFSIYCRNRSADSVRMFQRMPGAAGVQFVSASTSFWAQCGLTTAGQVMCWGPNVHRLYATIATVPTDTGPVPVKTALRFLSMQHGGHAQTCGISRSDSLVYCWGHNDHAQLGRPSPSTDDSIPAPVAGMGRAAAVSTENFATCALTLEGRAYCSKAGPGRMEPVAGTNEFQSLMIADDLRCAIDAQSSAWCWGGNALGDGLKPAAFRTTPVPVIGGLKFKKLSGERNKFACGITVDNDLYCWGDFPPAVIANRLGDKRYAPVQLMRGIKFRDVTGSLCGITTDGRALCW